MSHIGPILALTSAVVWATSVILFRIVGYTISPISLNLFKGVVGGFLLLVTLAFVGPLVPEHFRWDHFLWMFFNGAVGIALADTFFFKSLNLLGATRSAIVDCLYSPFIIVFAYLFLGEKLTPAAGIGALLIVSGVLFNSLETVDHEIEPALFWKGAAIGTLAMALMGFAIVAVKPFLPLYPLLWSTTVRMLGGTAALIVISLVRSDRRAIWGIFRPQRVWRVALPSAVLGAYVAFILWMGGFRYAPANIAGLLTQMSALFVVVLAVIILKERLTRWKLAALLLAFTGTVLVIW